MLNSQDRYEVHKELQLIMISQLAVSLDRGWYHQQLVC